MTRNDVGLSWVGYAFEIYFLNAANISYFKVSETHISIIPE
jgi:hypothetical protein